ncbi:Maf-like protein [Rhizobium sp. CG5]|uniref:Maf-like protein n=1 Tax=Rhizobium sp. CG5 TaxID=2726076 RepID=UPI0020335A58|nr:Maf-like protein [Rhizobium sp. CG5]MCM2476676.1 Maf-like protein [Rhizobium sp. CG5]
MIHPLVLASSSPFRRQLLENAGLVFTVDPPRVDERQIEALPANSALDPVGLAGTLSAAKALDVSRRNPAALVIGGDQTLSLGSDVYHKPLDLAAARLQLMALQGRTHHLNSAITLARDGGVVWEFVGIARMTMRQVTPAFLDAYLARMGPKALMSVGSYQLEGEGVQLFSSIDGDYFTVLGVPLLPLLDQLRTLGQIDE